MFVRFCERGCLDESLSWSKLYQKCDLELKFLCIQRGMVVVFWTRLHWVSCFSQNLWKRLFKDFQWFAALIETLTKNYELFKVLKDFLVASLPQYEKTDWYQLELMSHMPWKEVLLRLLDHQKMKLILASFVFWVPVVRLICPYIIWCEKSCKVNLVST